MEAVPGTTLGKEVKQTFLLLGMAASVLGGYLGLALALLRVLA